MSIRPGSSVTSPSSITSASSGSRSGDTSRMCSPLHHDDTGLDDRARVDVDHAVGTEDDRVVGGLRPGAREHRGGHFRHVSSKPEKYTISPATR